MLIFHLFSLVSSENYCIGSLIDCNLEKVRMAIEIPTANIFSTFSDIENYIQNGQFKKSSQVFICSTSKSATEDLGVMTATKYNDASYVVFDTFSPVKISESTGIHFYEGGNEGICEDSMPHYSDSQSNSLCTIAEIYINNEQHFSAIYKGKYLSSVQFFSKMNFLLNNENSFNIDIKEEDQTQFTGDYDSNCLILTLTNSATVSLINFNINELTNIGTDTVFAEIESTQSGLYLTFIMNSTNNREDFSKYFNISHYIISDYVYDIPKSQQQPIAVRYVPTYTIIFSLSPSPTYEGGLQTITQVPKYYPQVIDIRELYSIYPTELSTTTPTATKPLKKGIYPNYEIGGIVLLMFFIGAIFTANRRGKSVRRKVINDQLRNEESSSSLDDFGEHPSNNKKKEVHKEKPKNKKQPKTKNHH